MTTTSTDTAVRFFIACDREFSAVHGIGHTADEAVADAYRQSNSQAPAVREDDGEWLVTLSTGRVERFPTEEDAEAFAEEHEYRVSECTQRLYDHVVAKGGADFSWHENDDGLDDIDPEDGLYGDAACTQSLEDEATLPTTFFHACDGDVVRYWYQGQEQYERHERRTRDGRSFWYGIGSVIIEDDVTAEDYREYLAS